MDQAPVGFTACFWLLLIAFVVAILAAMFAALSGCGGSSGGMSSDSSASNANTIDWKLFGRIPQRTHYLPSKINPPLQKRWDYDDQALIEFPPAIAGDEASGIRDLYIHYSLPVSWSMA